MRVETRKKHTIIWYLKKNSYEDVVNYTFGKVEVGQNIVSLGEVVEKCILASAVNIGNDNNNTKSLKLIGKFT